MRLLWSSRSPFVRKVMIAVHELGLADRIALDRVAVAAREVNPGVMAFNPLGKIPTLILDDGEALFDSSVILEYLDTHHGTGTLFPTDRNAWRNVLRLHAIGDGLMELSVARWGEVNRGPLASSPHGVAMEAKTESGLHWLEHRASTLERLSAGSIAVAAALSHLDFRFAAHPWREGRASLAAWFIRFSNRPSMRATTFENVY
jgi:glutathione S-transferase